LLLRMKHRQIKIMPEAIKIAFPNLWEAWGQSVAAPIAVPPPIMEVVVNEEPFQELQPQVAIKRGRGRPKGSTKKEVA